MGKGREVEGGGFGSRKALTGEEDLLGQFRGPGADLFPLPIRLGRGTPVRRTLPPSQVFFRIPVLYRWNVFHKASSRDSDKF